MIKKLLIDSSYERGFFSSMNLTLLTIHYCKINNFIPVVSDSIMSLYKSRFKNVRTFSIFFGDLYDDKTNEPMETLEIAWVHNTGTLNFNDSSVIEFLRKINNDLLDNATNELINFINTKPSFFHENIDISIHYRGCDYLRNIPDNHKQNFFPVQFIKNIEYLISNKNLFVATDDKYFIKILKKSNYNLSYFKDVYRLGPGRGTHMKTMLQRVGFPSLTSPTRKALEVFRDVFWLSKSKCYIGSNSNLMYYSNLLNPNINFIKINE